MEAYVVIYDNNKEFAEQCAKVIQKLADEMNFSLEISIYTEEEALLNHYKGSQRTPDMFYISLNAEKTGLNIAGTLRKCGYGGGIIFLAEGYDDVMSTLETSPAGYIPKTMIKSNRFRNAFLRCFMGVKTEDAHLIQCKLAGQITGVPLNRFSAFYKEDNSIWGETPDGIGEIYLSWAEVLEKTSYDDYICVNDKRIIHMRTVGRVKDNMIVLRNQETYFIDRKKYETTVEAFYRYLNRNFPQRKRSTYEGDGTKTDK